MTRKQSASEAYFKWWPTVKSYMWEEPYGTLVKWAAYEGFIAGYKAGLRSRKIKRAK